MSGLTAALDLRDGEGHDEIGRWQAVLHPFRDKMPDDATGAVTELDHSASTAELAACRSIELDSYHSMLSLRDASKIRMFGHPGQARPRGLPAAPSGEPFRRLHRPAEFVEKSGGRAAVDAAVVEGQRERHQVADPDRFGAT